MAPPYYIAVTIKEICCDTLLAEPAFISVISSHSSPPTVGETVTLTCSVTLPSGVTGVPVFQWEGPGGESLAATQSMSRRRRVSSELQLREISPLNVGSYTCSATLHGSVSNITTVPPLLSNQLTHKCCFLMMLSFLQFPRLL